MLDLEAKTITLSGKSKPIIRFEVWWHVATVGLCKNLDDAIKQCDLLDIPAQQSVAPVPVAITEDTYEIIG
jgi:hypothetical protein